MDRSDLDLLSEVLTRNPGAEEPLGILLTPALKPSGYEATPGCCLPFAWTGGDGVHFSLADLGARGTPVVMTVPMNFDAPNLVLGKDLRDFLALGLGCGYFPLEELVYDRDAALTGLTDGSGLDRVARQALRDLRVAFGLAPWANAPARLDTLQAKYAAAIA